MSGTIYMYTDGSCIKNPGPAGIGIFLKYKNYEKKISEYIGIATNNIAELLAIKRGLTLIKVKDKKIKIYTDSNYCIGVFTKNWKINKNKEIIKETKEIIKTFKYVKFIKVKGHSTITGNNIADYLARKATKQKA